MRKFATLGCMILMFGSIGLATDVVEGTVEKIDTTTKSIVVKAKDGSEHTFHVVEHTVYQGGQSADAAAENGFHGLKEGSQVAIHYTTKQSQDTAEEVDRLGDNGMKASQGQLVRLDEKAKTVTIKAQDGTVHVYQMSDHTAEEWGKDVSADAQKSGKVTVYYTEQAGHKVAHFFSKTF